MAIGFDASSESHAGTTGSTNESSFSWSHSGGTPKGVLVFTFVNADADDATVVTYGGVNLTAVSRAVDNATGIGEEPRECKAWFLGSSVPTGTQTVEVTRNNNSNVMYAVAITVTAASDKDTAVHTDGIFLIESNDQATTELITDGSPGTDSMRFAAINSAVNTYSTTLPSTLTFGIVYVNTTFCTPLHHIDFGNNVIGVIRETTAGQGSRYIGWVGFDTDDIAAIYLAVKEITPGGSPTAIKDIIGRGILPFKR